MTSGLLYKKNNTCYPKHHIKAQVFEFHNYNGNKSMMVKSFIFFILEFQKDYMYTLKNTQKT